MDYIHEKVMMKLRTDLNYCEKEGLSEVQVLITPCDSKETQTLDLQLTVEEVEWIYNSKNSLADADDSEWMTVNNGGESSIKVTDVIELDAPTQWVLSVADKLIIKHRLRIVVDKLFTGFRSIKDQLAELLKLQLQQTIVSLEAIAILKSTSIDTDLCNCLSYPVPVMKEWLYDILEDCFEGGCDELTSAEQEYLKRLLNCLYAVAIMKLSKTDKDKCLKEVSNDLHEYIPMDVESDCNNTDSTHNQQNESEYSIIKSDYLTISS